MTYKDLVGTVGLLGPTALTPSGRCRCDPAFILATLGCRTWLFDVVGSRPAYCKLKNPNMKFGFLWSGGPCRTRTYDQGIMSGYWRQIIQYYQ